jgi:hypothetical protein
MARKKRVSETARKVTVLLTPAQELVLQVIEARRRERREERDSPSEIVADALWKFLADVEGVAQSQIEALVPAGAPVERPSNLRDFPK